MNSAAGFLGRKVRAVCRRVRALSGRDRDAPVILMYHRVADPPWDPWGLCVTPANFRDQLAALSGHRTVMAMDELVAALADGSVPPRATAITFDDGYLDNLEAARPLLEEAGLPATMFLSTANIASGEPFWWDELAAMVLGGSEPADFAFEVAGCVLAGAWPRQDALPADLKAWRYRQPTEDPRRKAYLDLWRVLHGTDADVRTLAFQALRDRIGDPGLLTGEAERPMNRAEATCLASPLVEPGAHGRTHVSLPSLPDTALEDEIAGGRADVAAIGDRAPPSGFAYPHGEWDARVREAVEAAGFAWAVTTRNSKIDPGNFDPFTLPRMEADNRSGRDLLNAAARLAVLPEPPRS